MVRKILAVKFIEMEAAKTGGKITVIFLTDLTTVWSQFGNEGYKSSQIRIFKNNLEKV